MANQYLYDLTDTWDGVGTTFDAIKINVTDTNSAAGSKLLNLQVGGSPLFTVQKDGAVTGSGTFTADRLTVTKTTANASAISSTGYSLTGSNATSLVDLAGTWNTTGAPTAIKLNITESSTPNAASSLLDLQVGGSSRFNISRTGQLRFGSSALETNTISTHRTGAPVLHLSSDGSGSFWFGNSAQTSNFILYRLSGSVGSFYINANSTIGWSSGSADSNTGDLFIAREAANTLAQRNGTNTQAFRVYRTWTDASNYEALELAHATYSSAQYSILRTITAGSGADNINLVLSPSGTGAITAQLPDGAATGGSARGSYAVDFQTNRETGSQSATGNYSAILGGRRNTASGTYSGVFCGDSCQATGQSAVAIGGNGCIASGTYSIASGIHSRANKRSQIAMAGGKFGGEGTEGDAQRSMLVARRSTSDANAAELFLDGSSERLTIPANTAWHADIRIIGRQAGGTNHAIYHRKCCIERTVNATALVSTVQTIGTDIETDANWDVAITADDTNDALKIEVTGVAATNIRWVAEVQLVEVAYA